jgi:hypothetical protein
MKTSAESIRVMQPLFQTAQGGPTPTSALQLWPSASRGSAARLRLRGAAARGRQGQGLRRVQAAPSPATRPVDLWGLPGPFPGRAPAAALSGRDSRTRQGDGPVPAPAVIRTDLADRCPTTGGPGDRGASGQGCRFFRPED